jgi:hypothetical protein
MRTWTVYWLGVMGATLLVSGCGWLGSLDLLGMETVITEDESLHKSEKIEDDRIEDKHPQYDAGLVIVDTIDGCEVGLNKSGSVTKLDILPFADREAFLRQRLFHTRGEALAAIGQTLPDVDLLPSMEIVNGFLKPFNDGLYAATELGAQDGSQAAAVNKRAFLDDLLADLQVRLGQASGSQVTHVENAIVYVAAGLLAGGATVSIPSSLQTRAESARDAFLAEPLFSRPIGFYTWNATLGSIFQQDRFLQNLGSGDEPGDLDFGLHAAIAIVLEEDAALLAAYQQILALYAGLTNPYASYPSTALFPYVNGLGSLDDIAAIRTQFMSQNPVPFFCTMAYFALLPASRSKDTAFFNSRYCESGFPAGASFIDELIAAIRSSELDLTPGTDSGWYDYQLWALETLLLPERGPESDHLLLTAAYKKKLIETFKSIITQTRETHVKQLMMGVALGMASQPIDVYPYYPVEPFPTFYLRTARGYRFLQTYLQAVLGPAFFVTAHRLHEDGAWSDEPLGTELDQVIELLYGIYILSAASVGLRPESYLLADELADLDQEAAIARAKEWLGRWRSDPDILKDPRVIVPVARDVFAGEATYWAVLGVKAIKVFAEYVPGYLPELVSADEESLHQYSPATGSDRHCEVRGFVPHEYLMLMEQMVEVRLGLDVSPPTRQELRALCDRYDNAEDIVAALEAL